MDHASFTSWRPLLAQSRQTGCGVVETDVRTLRPPINQTFCTAQSSWQTHKERTGERILCRHYQEKQVLIKSKTVFLQIYIINPHTLTDRQKNTPWNPRGSCVCSAIGPFGELRKSNPTGCSLQDTLQDSGDEGDSVDQWDSFSALSILENPPSPLRAGSFDCPPVLQVQQSDGTLAHFCLYFFYLQFLLVAENVLLGKVLAARKENGFGHDRLTSPQMGANYADATLGISTRNALWLPVVTDEKDLFWPQTV